MSDVTLQPSAPGPSLVPIDYAMIEDPAIRRAIRQVHDELAATVKRQQLEIEALLEMMIDKHLGSLSEFKRLLMRLQSGGPRVGRIHEAVTALTNGTPGAHPAHPHPTGVH